MGKEFNNSDTQVVELINQLVDKVKPIECNLHGQRLDEMQTDINSIAKMLGKLEPLVDKVTEIDDKLFRSNGERCLSERINDNKMELKRHMETHSKIKGNWKFWIPLIPTIIVSLFALMKALEDRKITKEEMKHITNQIKEITDENDFFNNVPVDPDTFRLRD